MACVLFCRPAHDGTVSYLHAYSKELVNFSSSQGHKTINKELEDANKKNITKIIDKHNPNLIMLNGHGAEDRVCGHKNEVIIQKDQNPELLKKSITYSLSCASAAELGPVSVENGATCFIGYQFDFALGKDPDSEAAPLKDKIAKLFLEPSNLLVKNLLRGGTCEESVQKAKIEMEKNISYLNTTDSFPEASHYAPFLFGNYLGLTAHGNINSSI